MENTLEEKAKFFAQYYNQVIMGEIETNYHPLDRSVVDSYNISGSLRRGAFKNAFLELNGLSLITDEDAIEIAYLVFNNIQPTYARIIGLEIMYYHFKGTQQSGIQVNDIKEIHTMTTHDIVVVYQYLQSKGYALPYMGLPVEQLIEYGWVTLKTNNKI